MTRTNIPLMPSARPQRAARSFPCFGFDVVEHSPSVCEIWQDGHCWEVCARHHVEHVCLMLLRAEKS